MNAIVDWEYYRSLCNKVNEAEFNMLEPQAERQVALVIGAYRWNSINPTTFYFDQLKYCICMVVNKLAEYNNSGVGRGVSSVSNDGYTENYVIQTQSQVASELRSSIIGWLSGTGLAGAYKC